MSRARKLSPAPMIPHWAWDAPRVVTMEPNDYRAPECRRAEWSGENVYSGGLARCVPLPHWDAIVAESERVGWPLQYRRDLYVHDRASLAYTPASEPFLWVLRESGTHFYPVSFFDGAGHGAVHMAESIPDIFGPKECRLYTWDGRYLRQHKTAETAAEALRVLRRRWEGKEEDAA